ncbi:hypothetical protein V8D89_002467 [Ganoderma adspersum]
MSTRVTRKRARTNADEDSVDVKPDPSNAAIPGHEANAPPGSEDAMELKKDEDFWFEDGTVILHAGDVEFRVYGGLLEGHSMGFKELFAQSHPTRTVSIAGRTEFLCPVIKLSDSPHDLRHVLRSCMPKQAGSTYETVTPSFDMVSVAIRLGQKYKITDMYQKGLAFLKGHYTEDLDAWTAIDTWSPPDWDGNEAIGVINLARLTGELTLLPVAFMTCALSEDANPVLGFTREDGSLEHLTLDDLSLCFKAKGRLRETGVAALCRVLNPTVSPNCKVASQCLKALKMTFRGDAAEANVTCMTTRDVLLSTASNYFTVNSDGGKHTLCQACVAMINERDKTENRAMWDRLPELLGIQVPGWTKAAVAAPAGN